ncbi:hypothetical protein FWF48_00985 [Candidatus Saccharibacteria bacterium]|nr:hypothetical protein [Candidatus Saccharibacteria bacterium]
MAKIKAEIRYNPNADPKGIDDIIQLFDEYRISYLEYPDDSIVGLPITTINDVDYESYVELEQNIDLIVGAGE